jgi:hypothetical protein
MGLEMPPEFCFLMRGAGMQRRFSPAADVRREARADGAQDNQCTTG